MSPTPPTAPAPIESWEVLDLLTSLVQKSLVLYEEVERGDHDQRAAALRAALGEAAFAAAWAEGRTMSLEEAASFALEGADG